MENLIKQRRVSFAASGQEELNPTSIRERRGQLRQTESFKGDNNEQNWFWRQFVGPRSRDYDSSDGEFSVSVAAAAFAVHSLEETNSKSRDRGRQDLQDPYFGGVPRRLSIKDGKYPGEASIRKPAAQNPNRPQEIAFPTSKPSRVSSVKPNRGGSKADAWERAEIEKIKKRYEKMKSRILAWENDKKMHAKIKLENKKIELERRKERNLQHYQFKIERIDGIATGARAQMEEKRRNEESEVKEKAKKIRSTGKFPASAYFFCF